MSETSTTDFEYITTAQAASKWHMKEAEVRRYCLEGCVVGAVKSGGRWLIPSFSLDPRPYNMRYHAYPSVVDTLLDDKARDPIYGIYKATKVMFAYTSAALDNSALPYDLMQKLLLNEDFLIRPKSLEEADMVVETLNHFRCIDYIFEHFKEEITEDFIKNLHAMMKDGTSDTLTEGFAVGDYKLFPEDHFGKPIYPPLSYLEYESYCSAEQVPKAMSELIKRYNFSNAQFFNHNPSFLHFEIMCIRPFADCNGRIARLLHLKELLKVGQSPFIINGATTTKYMDALDISRVLLNNVIIRGQVKYGALLASFKIPSPFFTR